MKVRNCDSPEILTGIFSICLIAMIDCRAPCQAAAAHHVDHENYSNHSSDNTVSLQAGELYRKRTNESIFWGKFAGQTHLNSDAKIADEGHPQGGEGTHKGCPYLLFSAKKPASSRQRRMEFAIAHYDLHSSRRYALRRAPTRGAPTRFRQPHVGLSQFDAIALGKFAAHCTRNRSQLPSWLWARSMERRAGTQSCSAKM